MKMYLGGQWVSRDSVQEVLNPFDGSVVDTVPKGTTKDVEAAVISAERGFAEMKKLTAFDRYTVLMKAVDLIVERKEDLAKTITLEEGKVISEGRLEVDRCIQTITTSAEEAKRLNSEVIPLDAAPGNAMKFGFTLRVPVGVVAAVTPFNFPLNLVAHKIGPALAAGNSVIIKPASDTPLSALKLTEVMIDAGFPPESLQCITGSGGTIGDAIVSNPGIRKEVTMELGSNSPLIVLPDADLEKVAEATAQSGFSNAGQVCISTQRVIVDQSVYSDYLDVLVPVVESLKMGNPLEDPVKLGPMVRESDAERVSDWIGEAVSDGARLLTGGDRDRAIVSPAVIADAKPDMRVCREELFGPAVTVTPASNIDEAIELANDSRFGLSAAVFTENINNALKFALEVDSGNLNINSGTQFRADLMPYGGLKDSGMGKEGPKYAIEEMTELKMVVIHR